MRFVVILLAVGIASLGTARTIDMAGYVPGTIEDAVVDGSHAYCATVAGLLVLDVADIAAPVQVAFLPLNGSTVLAVADGIACVSGWLGEGLRIVDISDPTVPTLLATCPVVNMPTDLVIVNGFLYVSVQAPGRLQVFDIRDPYNPTETALVPLADSAYGLAARDDILYIAANMAGLLIFDISDPWAPHVIGSCDVSGQNSGVAVAGNHVYLTTGMFGGLIVVDVSDPTAPVEVGSFWPGFSPTDEIAVESGRAYMPVSGLGLRIVDVTDPANPGELGLCPFIGSSRKIALLGTAAFVSSGYRGLHVVDTLVPAAPVVVGWYAAVGDAADVRAYGDRAYVGGGHFVDAKSREGVAGLATVSVPPQLPSQVVDFLPMELPPQAIELAGTSLYVLDLIARLHTADLADPAAPVFSGSHDLQGTGEDLDIAGTLAFAACGEGGLCIVDVAEPDAMDEIGHIAIDEYASGVVVDGDMAYVTEYYGGLYTVDVSDPTSPVIRGIVPTPSNAHAVAQANDLVFVAGGTAGLLVFTIDDPEHPEPAGAYDTPGNAQDVAVAWPFVVVADGLGGVRAFDFSDPSYPTEAGVYPQAKGACALTINHQGQILACALEKGLYVLEVPIAVTAPDGDPGAAAVPADLEVAVPNPFNPQTTVSFTLADPGRVMLRVYDPSGRRVCNLIDGEVVVAGRRTVVWNGCDDAGRPVPAGIYLCRLETSHGALVRKLALVR